MRRAVAAAWNVPESGVLPALCIVVASFSIGALAGGILSVFASGEGAESLRTYLEGFLTTLQAGGVETPMAIQVWDTLRWPLLALLLGFTCIGLLGLPLLFAVRGFLLAFSIFAFVRLFGSAGCLMAFLIFGISGALSLPVLFVLGVQSLGAARVLAGRFLGETKRQLPYGKAYFLRCGGCAGALCVCILLERLIVPGLVSAAAALLVN